MDDVLWCVLLDIVEDMESVMVLVGEYFIFGEEKNI